MQSKELSKLFPNGDQEDLEGFPMEEGKRTLEVELRVLKKYGSRFERELAGIEQPQDRAPKPQLGIRHNSKPTTIVHHLPTKQFEDEAGAWDRLEKRGMLNGPIQQARRQRILEQIEDERLAQQDNSKPT